MDKAKAIDVLGGTAVAAARALGITFQAVHQWPDVLPDRIAQRVLGVVAMRELPTERLKQLGIDVRARAAEEAAEA